MSCKAMFEWEKRPILTPTKCPDCGKELRLDIGYLKCGEMDDK